MKPSERIRQAVADDPDGTGPGSWIVAILDYLDERDAPEPAAEPAPEPPPVALSRFERSVVVTMLRERAAWFVRGSDHRAILDRIADRIEGKSTP